MTEPEVKQILAVVKANWPTRFFVDGITISLWLRYLCDVDPDAVGKAVHHHIATKVHPPAIAEILALIAAPVDAGEMTAIEEWGEVERAISKFGRDRSPVFEHPITARVVAGLGWRSICDSENLQSERARFLDAWNGAIVGHRQREALALVRPAAPGERTLEAGTPARAIAGKGGAA